MDGEQINQFKQLTNNLTSFSEAFGSGHYKLDLVIVSIVCLIALYAITYMVQSYRRAVSNYQIQRERKLNKSFDATAKELDSMMNEHRAAAEYLRLELQDIRSALSGLREGIELRIRDQNSGVAYLNDQFETDPFHGELD